MVYLYRAIQAPYAAGDVAEEDQLAILLPGHSDWKIGLQIPINLHLAAPLFDPDRGDDESDNRESQDEKLQKPDCSIVRRTMSSAVLIKNTTASKSLPPCRVFHDEQAMAVPRLIKKDRVGNDAVEIPQRQESVEKIISVECQEGCRAVRVRRIQFCIDVNQDEVGRCLAGKQQGEAADVVHGADDCKLPLADGQAVYHISGIAALLLSCKGFQNDEDAYSRR